MLCSEKCSFVVGSAAGAAAVVAAAAVPGVVAAAVVVADKTVLGTADPVAAGVDTVDHCWVPMVNNRRILR